MKQAYKMLEDLCSTVPNVWTAFTQEQAQSFFKRLKEIAIKAQENLKTFENEFNQKSTISIEANLTSLKSDNFDATWSCAELNIGNMDVDDLPECNDNVKEAADMLFNLIDVVQNYELPCPGYAKIDISTDKIRIKFQPNIRYELDMSETI